MRFRRRARLDPGQVTDVRGRRIGRGGLAVGGGGLGLAGLVVYLLFTLLSGGGALGQLAPLEDQQVGLGDSPSEVSQECRTGEDANERQDCRIVGVINSAQEFWDGVFRRSGRQYSNVDTVFFTDQVETACGSASSQVGPFYCPGDQQVYIDLGFFDELQARFGAGAAPFAQAYVIAHEYGHHVQSQLGVLESIGGDTPGSGEPGRPLRAPGGLLRRRLGRQRRRDGARRRGHAGRHQRRARRRNGDRRRPHSGAHAGPGDPGDVDTRLLGAAAPLVLARLRGRPPGRVRHLLRLDLATASTVLASDVAARREAVLAPWEEDTLLALSSRRDDRSPSVSGAYPAGLRSNRRSSEGAE